MLTRLALLMGTLTTDPSATAEFMEKFDPEHVQRIAFTRDADNELQIILSSENGPLRDGATEVIQAAKFLDDDGKQSFLITMQRPTEKLGALNEEDMGKIVAFFGQYFKTEKTDVFLAAKSDAELDDSTVTWYATIKGDTITASQVDAVKDFVATGYGVYILVDGKLGKVPAKMLDMNIDSGAKSILSGADDKIVAVGQDTKLARGPKLELAPGQSIDTIAYVKNDSGVMKMILLDATTLEEIKVIDFDGNYATAGHDDTVVYIIDVQNVGDGNESFDIVCRPVAEMIAAA